MNDKNGLLLDLRKCLFDGDTEGACFLILGGSFAVKV